MRPFLSMRIRLYQPSDRNSVERLYRNSQVRHVHLDWRGAFGWFNHTPFLVAEETNHWGINQLIGAFACPADIPDVSWWRLVIIRHRDDIALVNLFWREAQKMLLAQNIRHIAILTNEPWLYNIANQNGFAQSHHVVSLIRRKNSVPDMPKLPDGVRLRSARADDMAQIADIDKIAFATPWSMSMEMLSLGMKGDSYTTILEHRGVVIGYQLTNLWDFGAHLSRLAVAPGWQGRGLGRALTIDMFRYWISRGIHTFSVNTQSDNDSSLALYRSLDFRYTGENLPVWQLRI